MADEGFVEGGLMASEEEEYEMDHDADEYTDLLMEDVDDALLAAWKQRAGELLDVIPELAPTAENGEPTRCYSASVDGTVTVRTLGLSLAGPFAEIGMTAPVEHTLPAAEIVLDLAEATLRRQNVEERTRIGRLVWATRFGITYVVTKSEEDDFPVIWKQLTQATGSVFEARELVFQDVVDNLGYNNGDDAEYVVVDGLEGEDDGDAYFVQCANCGKGIEEGTAHRITCKTCVTVSYCSDDCRAEDDLHPSVCKAAKAAPKE
uniref:MYND-type domain-containing protein n=1 Tax=Phaeomonas parva TaxID=124430 RepID=A0A7S1XWC7_9STRA|mmetsp:Transcript_38627/g.120970  ORF Transcript_38627/g.120970 Transcript_38627/m.120970 type:complete len:262 (+) Transcript_38627:303-1088(+)